jgi:peptide-methionine (S)-S-oxide reductase
MEKTEKIVFGGGCFWCTEAIFKELRGIVSAAPGYAGGTKSNPTYEQVSAGGTGHIEVVQIEYDPNQITFEKLLTVFFATHDPTTKDRQGNDVGTQYNSAIFYTTDEQKNEAEKFIAGLNETKTGELIVTQVLPLDTFWPAENYHKDYFAHHPDALYCQLVIDPKLEKVQKEFGELLTTNKK